MATLSNYSADSLNTAEYLDHNLPAYINIYVRDQDDWSEGESQVVFDWNEPSNWHVDNPRTTARPYPTNVCDEEGIFTKEAGDYAAQLIAGDLKKWWSEGCGWSFEVSFWGAADNSIEGESFNYFDVALTFDKGWEIDTKSEAFSDAIHAAYGAFANRVDPGVFGAEYLYQAVEREMAAREFAVAA